MSEDILCMYFFVFSTALAFFFYRRKKYHAVLITVLSLCLFLKIYCSLDQYLHEWDERYHALVAKNMLAHPLTPSLYAQPNHDFDYKDWTANHIWLSKPPLALWSMAVSIGIFGTHEFAVRAPGILFSLGSVLLTFLIARNFFGMNVALLAAYVHAIHGMSTDLASGRISSDGVETCFLFFAQLAIWFAVRKNQNDFGLRDYLLVGMVTGLAVLSKWQPAFLCLVVMFVYQWKNNDRLKHVWFSALAFCASACVFLPWIFYCLANFPVETKWMLSLLLSPMLDPESGHQGAWYSQFFNFSNYFGPPALVLCALVFFHAVRNRNRKLLVLLVWCMVPLLIFSIAEMQRGTYLMLGAPAIIILVSYCATQVVEFLRWTKVSFALAWACVLSIAGFSIEKLYLYSNDKSRTTAWSERIKFANYQPGTILYNEPHCIEIMFYHDGVIAYPFSEDQAASMQNSIEENKTFVVHEPLPAGIQPTVSSKTIIIGNR